MKFVIENGEKSKML